MENPFFFENDKHNLFGILHSPSEKNNVNAGFVFCYPFAFEAGHCREIYATFARRLSAIGYYVLRFNYMGTGDSSGNLDDVTIETQISDIIKAIAVLQEKTNILRIGLMGIGLGASLAALAAGESVIKVDPLILWDPIVDVKKFLDDGFRQSVTFQSVIFHEVLYDRKQIINKLITDGKVEHQGYILNIIDGNIISRDFYLQSTGLDLQNHIRNYFGDLLVIQIDKSDVPFRPELLDLMNICKHNEKTLNILHVNESEPWWTPGGKSWISKPDQIFDVTENWIRGVMER